MVEGYSCWKNNCFYAGRKWTERGCWWRIQMAMQGLVDGGLIGEAPQKTFDNSTAINTCHMAHAPRRLLSESAISFHLPIQEH